MSRKPLTGSFGLLFVPPDTVVRWHRQRWRLFWHWKSRSRGGLGWRAHHHGQAVQECLATGGAARIQLESLPGDAPDLNPDAGIWNYLKRVELRNRCCATLRHLRHVVQLATARLRHKRCVIRRCFHEAGYRVELPVHQSVASSTALGNAQRSAVCFRFGLKPG